MIINVQEWLPTYITATLVQLENRVENCTQLKPSHVIDISNFYNSGILFSLFPLTINKMVCGHVPKK